MTTIERIVCAAIYIDDGVEHPLQPRNITRGVVISGLRHCNCIVTARLWITDRAVDVDRDSGFVTSNHRYVNRQEAMQIAVNAGQVQIADVSDPDCLYSEDLY